MADLSTTHNCVAQLVSAGIADDDAKALRRIAMTLHRWHELECGTGEGQTTYSIERDGNEPDSKPYMRMQRPGPNGSYRDSKFPVPDRETGARKRLAKIMQRYPSLSAYVQGDPRGAALYILRPGDVPEGAEVDSYYSRGLAVYK